MDSKKATMEEMVKAVKAHAIAHYEEGGWDTIVECYSDEELAAEIGSYGSKTLEEAIRDVGIGCGAYEDVRQDHLAEARACGLAR